MKSHKPFTTWIAIIISGILFFTGPSSLKAQSDEFQNKQKSDFRSRLYFGGGFGLQFGTVTLIELSPLAGYKITPRLSAGISPTYKYYSYKGYYGPSQNLKTNVFGGSIFARCMLFQGFFAHTEYESLFYNTRETGNVIASQQFNSWFLGGGYQQNMGGNAGMYILVLWNMLDQINSPYTNPVIRVGFSFGL